VRAAAEAAHAGLAPFILTARAENFLHGRPDLADTIKRLQAFQDAGADVVYAPGLRTIEDIATVVRSVDRPVNVLAGLAGAPLDLAALSEAGVKRVSVGSALMRAALGAFLRAAREIREQGTFTLAAEGVSHREVSAMFGALT
jgi:2-methylisocitrate lyase-like PEP mutase family enzyme